MKIKIVYGEDMRLWRYNITEAKPPQSAYKDLLAFVCKTFEFDDVKQFRVTFKDDDDDQTTMASQEDFEDAFAFGTKSGKKSLKLYIVDSAGNRTETNEKDEKEEKLEPIQSAIKPNNDNDAADNNNPPTTEEITAFLSDDFTMDLLSDLFVSVFEALQAANFEISFVECTKGVILSSNDKYIKLTTNKVWPHFMNELLPLWSVKIERFAIPMIKMNGINTDMLKQWIPTLFSMMKHHTQNDKWKCKGKWKHCKGGRGRKHHRGGRHHRGHHHRGHHGHHGHHRGHHRGYHTNHRGGWRGRGGAFGPNHHPQHYGHGYGYGSYHGYAPSAPPMANQQYDEIEAEVFEYTEELVEIMNMGFTKMSKIKELLAQHKGDKQLVVQELVSAKY